MCLGQPLLPGLCPLQVALQVTPPSLGKAQAGQCVVGGLKPAPPHLSLFRGIVSPGPCPRGVFDLAGSSSKEPSSF